ncbi:MAG: four helix bundle protein [Bacteroidetes bacterium]|nr:four helix bundle protein [Bacteroidota bacterium]
MAYQFINIGEEFLHFGAEIIIISQRLSKSSAHKSLINQLLRSGTAAGANYEEACGTEDKADFIHKLHISYKELREADYWLRLIRQSGILNTDVTDNALAKSELLLNIIGKSLITAKKGREMKDEE